MNLSRQDEVKDLIEKLSKWYDYLESLSADDLMQQWINTTISDRKYTYQSVVEMERLLRLGHTGGIIEGLKLMLHAGITHISTADYERWFELARSNWCPNEDLTKETITKTGE